MAISVSTFIIRMVCVMILVGVALTHFVSEYALIFLIFIALNFGQSTFSWGICPPSMVMKAMGWVGVDPEECKPVPRIYFMGKGMPPQPVVGVPATSKPTEEV